MSTSQLLNMTSRQGSVVTVILFAEGGDESRKLAARKARQVANGDRLRYLGADVHAGGTMHHYSA